MKIINLSRNTVLADNALEANMPLARIIGLMKRKEFKKNEALVIKPCNAVHTFFMRFPIDVIFLDRKNKVIFLKNNLRPWQVTPIYWQAKLVIELPSNMISGSQTAIGDEIAFR